MAAVIAALIGGLATVAAAIITTRSKGPAGMVPKSVAGFDAVAVPAPISKSLWLGIAGLLLWIIPIAGYCVCLPGLWIGIRESGGARRYTAGGITTSGLALGLAVLNSAIGAYQGYHGGAWFQR